MNRLRAWFARATLYPAGPATQANARASLLDGMAFSVMNGAFLPYVGPFILALGGNAYAVSLAVALPALVQTAAQLPGARLASRAARRVPLIVAWSWAARLAYVPLAIIPFLPVAPGLKVAVFLAIYAYMSLPTTIANVAWTALMAEIFPPTLRGRVFADRNMWLTVVSLAASLASGVLVLVLGWPWYYPVLIGVTFAGQVVSIGYLRRLTEPAERVDGASPPPEGNGRAGSAGQTADGGGGGAARREEHRAWRRFWAFALASFVYQLGMGWPQGIWPVVFIRVDGLPVYWFGVWNTISALATVLTVRRWGRWHDRHGPIAAAALSAALFAVTVPLYLWVTSGPGIGTLNVLGGVAMAGMNLALFNGLLETAPSGARPQAVAWFNVLVGLANLTGPLLGTAQFHALGLAPTLWTAGGLRLAGAGLLSLPLLVAVLRPSPRDIRTAREM